jgi:hypothetical protein
MGVFMRDRWLIIVAGLICIAGLMTACGGHGGGGSTTTPVVYNPDLRYPDDNDTTRYYDPNIIHRRVNTVNTYNDLWRRRFAGSDLTYLTPLGLQQEDLRAAGSGWLARYPAQHLQATVGAVALAPKDYLFSYSANTRSTEPNSPVFLSATGDSQAYAVYAVQGVPPGFGVTNISLLGEWTYVSMDATGGLRIGLSSYSEETRRFSGYATSGDLYHPAHWNYTSRAGIPASPDGTVYILVAIHDGLEARIDSVMVTIQECANN